MAIYTVHVPPDVADPERAAERMVFIRDGFSFWAFLLPPLWLIARRLWLALAAWIALAVGLTFLVRLVGPDAGEALGVLFALWVGLEARDVRRWCLGLGGWRAVGLVEAGSREAAERRFFDEWSRTSSATVLPPTPGRHFTVPGANEVIGLFPTSQR